MTLAPSSVGLQGLTKNYGETPAVRDVDLDIWAGEFMTFLGPSGSGKTTTLNMIAGFVEPTNGDVLIDGQSVRAVPTHKRGMGMVFQGYALFPHLSVGDNVGFPLKRRGIAKKKRRQLVEEALGTVELDGFADRSPQELSGGQQQRVSLARAIVYRPPVLLMDDPLGALDKRLRDALQEEIRAIHRQVGTTFVYVTHDQEEALSLSDRIAVYNHGGIEQVGTPRDLYDRPATLFVARFLGESTLLCGVVDTPDLSVLRTGSRRIPVTNPNKVTGAAIAMIRPERLRLLPLGDPTGVLEIRVQSETYLGHVRKLGISLPDGTAGVVSESPGLASTVVPGDSALLAWDVADAVVLPGEE
ncbi:MAG: ABC transporter ATP-binding protein [Flavobacterium sp.]|nr:ABC transporter ATP-binding protein [Aeromicrobium sp.]